MVMITKERAADELGARRADSKGRITLGPAAVGKEFDITMNAAGQFILTPMARVPEREVWLYRNPAALSLLAEGIAAAQTGDVSEPEDFSRYAEAVTPHP